MDKFSSSSDVTTFASVASNLPYDNHRLLISKSGSKDILCMVRHG